MTPAAATEPRRAYLLGRDGRHAIVDEFVLGRGHGADLLIDSADASRRHARIVRNECGQYVLEDLDSKNGTYLDGRPIPRPTTLSDGDAIFVAGCTFRFLSPEAETTLGTALGAAKPHSIHMLGKRLGIGRSDANEIVLDDPNVSRFHAELIRRDGAVQLHDLASRNGTYVDGRRVEERQISTGAEVRIGPYRLIYDGDRVIASNERRLLHLDANAATFTADERQILSETSLSIVPGELTAIIGESGSGKTTLIRLLAGISRPSSGSVTLGGENVLSRTTDIAYVPQHDVVHAALTVNEVLTYAARLRLPADSSRDEVRERIEVTLDELSLTGKGDSLVRNLSGGQRRRIGLGMELLARPSLICLDEPTTGLDPMLEEHAMTLFRELASESRTVVLVTHATHSLEMCDKLAVMGSGGRLAFFGAPAAALDFFDTKSYHDLYRALASKPSEEWAKRHSGERPPPRPVVAGAEVDNRDSEDRPRVGILHQASILASRYSRAFRRDRRNLLILFGQVPIIALALLGLYPADVFSHAADKTGDATFLLFLTVTLAIWFGLLDAAREVIKERPIFLRERAIGVRTSAYLLSKVSLLFAVTALQVGLLCLLLFEFRPLHEPSIVYVGLVADLLLTALAAVGLGLLTSTLASSEDQATSLVPLLLVFQLFFAGAIIPLAKMSQFVASLTDVVVAKWSYALAGTLIGMNQRIALSPRAARSNSYGSDFFAASKPLSYAVLAGFSIAFVCLARLALSRRG